MDVIKHTSKAVLPAGRSMHSIICIKFVPAGEVYSVKANFTKLKVFFLPL